MSADDKARVVLLLEEEYVERGLRMWQKVYDNIANVRALIDELVKQEPNV